ncbi:MAG: GNAT family N-acetyltransferase [Chlorobiaceae bacterium]|nr:GNAT family N-acetyltransferase [Chlorobiaceae bacterium]
MELLNVKTEGHFKIVRELFEEYAASLDYEICFNNFAAELARLPGEYAPPSGRLMLGFHNGSAAGCVALRRVEDGVCEMKRLYVRAGFRGAGIGRALAEAVVRQAREIGYKSIRLDTVNSMRTAQTIYESMGFTDTKPCCSNPPEGVRYMELPL